MPASWADLQDAKADAPSAPLHVPTDWAEASERIQYDGIRKLVVIGATDMGKSTFCRFLLDRAAQTGRNAALLDTDPGQKTIGPPACVTLGDSQGLRLAFVGSTSPIAGWRALIGGTHRLARQADAEVLIVNTSGLLAGPGRRLKAAKIEAIEPDLLIALGQGADLEAILKDHAHLPALRLCPSPEARRKTDGERRRSRREAFRRYFAIGSELTFERHRLRAMPLGEPLPLGLLLGLSDAQGTDLGLGILSGCSEDQEFRILTPVPSGRIHRLTPGTFCLDEKFSEIRKKAAT